MSTQLWQVIDTEEHPGTVMANVLDVPADLQGHTIRQVLEMAGYPYRVENANVLPAQTPDATATNISWDRACDQARQGLADQKDGSAEMDDEESVLEAGAESRP